MTAIIIRDSITDASVQDEGRVVICGSHGGKFTGALASEFNLRAVLFFDAGFGLNRAGVAGIEALDSIAMAAAAIDVGSAPIGDATYAASNGRLSFINKTAISLGLMPGMLVSEASERLTSARVPVSCLPPLEETFGKVTTSHGLDVHLLDSASMVGPQHEGQIVITGSHGGLVGGDPNRALKANARFAAFNDAGIGKDEAGIARLSALDKKKIPAVTVSCNTAEIGSALSTYSSGVISRMNRAALRLGMGQGQPLIEALEAL